MPGRNVRLTIDLDIQRAAEQALADGVRGAASEGAERGRDRRDRPEERRDPRAGLVSRRSTRTGSSRTASRTSRPSSPRIARDGGAPRALPAARPRHRRPLSRRPRRSSRSSAIAAVKERRVTPDADAALHAVALLLQQALQQLGQRVRRAHEPDRRARALVRHLLLPPRRRDLPRERQAGSSAAGLGGASSASAAAPASTSWARTRACCRRPTGRRSSTSRTSPTRASRRTTRTGCSTRAGTRPTRSTSRSARATSTSRRCSSPSATPRSPTAAPSSRRTSSARSRRPNEPTRVQPNPPRRHDQHRRARCSRRCARGCCARRTGRQGTATQRVRAVRDPGRRQDGHRPARRRARLRDLRLATRRPTNPSLVTVVVIERGGHGGVAGALTALDFYSKYFKVAASRTSAPSWTGRPDVERPDPRRAGAHARAAPHAARGRVGPRAPARLAAAVRARRRGRARPRRDRHGRRRRFVRRPPGDLPRARRGSRCACFAFIDVERFRRFEWLLYIGTIALVAAVFLLGFSTRGSRRWIQFPFFQFQPSELGKLTLLLALAALIARNAGRIGTLRFVLAVHRLCRRCPTVLVFVEPDFGTALVYLASLVCVLFVAGVRLRHLALLGGIAVLARRWPCCGRSPPAACEVLKPYQVDRLTSFLHPDQQHARTRATTSPRPRSRSARAGSSGAASQGATQTLNDFLPERRTDFVFAVLGEERGFVGRDAPARPLPGRAVARPARRSPSRARSMRA